MTDDSSNLTQAALYFAWIFALASHLGFQREFSV